MTLPDERTRAVMHTLGFLYDLTDPKITPRVPREIRRRARLLVKHYPNASDMAMPDKAFEPYRHRS
jgi:hypothetical protein